MPVNTKLFRDRLAEREMSQRELARRMGLDSAAVSLMLRGRREMKIAEAATIARLLGVPAQEVMTNAGVNVSSRGQSTPVVGIMDGLGEVTWASAKKLGTAPRPTADLPADLRAIECHTEGSALDYMAGWVLFTTDPKDGVDPDCIERLCVVKLRTGGVSGVAQVRRGHKKGRWNLSGPLGNIKDADLEFASPILLITT